MSDEAPRWRLVIQHEPAKVLRRVPRDVLRRLDRAILSLADDPRPRGYKKLAGFENVYRIRVGDWRITYAIEEDVLVVMVIEIAPRGGAYRNL